jgi:hypothetical protein
MPRPHLLGARSAVLALLAACATPPAQAVITTVTNDTGSSSHQLVLRVGSAAGVDTVNFAVTGNNVAVSPAAVTGTPDIDVWVQPLRPAGTTTASRPVSLTVDSSAGLACQSGGCGATVIPFSKVSWTATNNSAAGDIQSGSFSGGAGQQIASFEANATYCDFFLVICWTGWIYQTQQLNQTRLRFYYANDVLYPAGTYVGTVRFTATMQ